MKFKYAARKKTFSVCTKKDVDSIYKIIPFAKIYFYYYL